ncbi:MAG: CoA transferase [Salinarimonadaceae bacterium]|nr:MAG: CoA transferase [Salinarimonadaceae bacterium]
MGVLAGTRVVEFAGQGPAPFCAMMLADMGAEVVRIERNGLSTLNTGYDPMRRRRHSVSIDLKHERGADVALRIIGGSDALIEGHRPGVMERLGLGPERCWEVNPRLVYGRVTGWGQEGPLAKSPGRDINYIALSGALHAMGGDRPIPPLNLVGDFGGGGMLLAVGLLGALIEAGRTGRGQVVDAAMIDGAALLMTSVYGLLANRQWVDERQANLLDGGAPYYRTYRCADGQWLAVGALDERSMAGLLDLLEIETISPSEAFGKLSWARLEPLFEARFLKKARDTWCGDARARNACVSPVLSLTDARKHEQNSSRGVFHEHETGPIPAPAPRFSGHPRGASVPLAEAYSSEETDALLCTLLNLGRPELDKLRRERVISTSDQSS